LVLALSACQSTGKTSNKINEPVAYPPKILEHKGSAFGANAPEWIMASLKGYKAVEALPEYKGKMVAIVEAQGASQDGAEMAASRLDAQPRIAAYMSTKVKDTFAGAQVGDKDKIETYMERVVKSMASATFTGFLMEDSWWVHLQTYTAQGKPDKQEYRVIQLWTIDKALLQKQVDLIFAGAAADEPKTAEKQTAIDRVKEAFYEGF
jgi:hypothetical protein